MAFWSYSEEVPVGERDTNSIEFRLKNLHSNHPKNASGKIRTQSSNRSTITTNPFCDSDVWCGKQPHVFLYALFLTALKISGEHHCSCNAIFT